MELAGAGFPSLFRSASNMSFGSVETERYQGIFASFQASVKQLLAIIS
jgi:hypothetical protein